MDKTEDKIRRRKEKFLEYSEKIDDLKRKLVEAGWKDAQHNLNLQKDSDYAERLSEWLFIQYQSNFLDLQAIEFFKEQMAIDIEQVFEAYPGREIEALAYHIKDFFSKDEEQMIEMIKSQKRKRKTA